VSRGIALLLCMLCPCAWATDVSPIVTNGMLGVRIDGLVLPETLPAELSSGLTNRLYLRISLLDGGSPVRTHSVEFAIRYDLWDEKFVVTRTVDNASAAAQSTASRAEVQRLLSLLSVPNVFAAAELPRAREVTLRIELLLNPIRREKLRMIRKWVAENTTPDAGSDRGLASSGAIFNRIFEQYADGSEIAALWRTELTSRPFHPDDVHEGH
jgi:hypothetical protein